MPSHSTKTCTPYLTENALKGFNKGKHTDLSRFDSQIAFIALNENINGYKIVLGVRPIEEKY